MSDPSLADLYDFQAKEPQQALDAAIAQVRKHCGWSIAPSATETATVWSEDGRRLFVPTLNLTAVVSVTQDGSLVPSTEYTFQSYGIIIGNGVCFSRRIPLTVQFTHGYSVMPDDVKAVILSLAQRSISDTRGLVTNMSATGATAASLVETYGPQFSDTDKAKLSPYRIAGFA